MVWLLTQSRAPDESLLNARKIAVMKVSHGMFGPELLFLMYKCCFLRESARTATKSRINLSTANGPIGSEIALPSVFHGHNFI